MQKDKRKKGFPNEACELHKKQVKQGVEVDYCPKCGTKTIFVCEKCFCEIQDIDEKHIICDRCEAERKQKLEETKEKGKAIAAKGGKVIIGFAGSTADAFTLFELFEAKLKTYSGDLTRAAVELAKQWRMDKQLRNLEAMMIASDGVKMFLISGVGDVLEPQGDTLAIGSGGDFARSAAEAYLDSKVELSAEEIAKKSVKIASEICIYTNSNIITEVI